MARSLITKIFSRAGRRQGVFLEIRPDGIAWATSGGSFGFLECSPAKRAQELRKLVDQQGWSGAAATLILPLDQYQVFQLERPEGIDDSEVGDALKWKLKDFLDFNPSEAVSDVFPFPQDASRGRGELVNVVAARKSLVRELVELVNSCQLELVGIDIGELALRGMIARLDSAGRGAALVHMRARFGQMIVCKGNVLYLSRRLDVTADDLADASRQEQALQSLALEMQRSLDYYESQLGQVPPSIIRFVTRDTSLPLSSMLGSYLAGSVEPLDWSEFGLDDPVDSRCLAVWSASHAMPAAGDGPEQEVNLYAEELRPRKERLQFASLASLAALVLVFIVVSAVYVRYDNNQLEQDVSLQQARMDQLTRSVEQLSREVESRQPDPQVKAALERVTETLARRQRLLDQVENLMSESTSGFSDPLLALAQQVPDGLWLTRIQLNAQNGQVGLEGRTQSGSLVPVYLEALGEKPAFQGKTFGAFRLERDQEGRWIDFRVATRAGAES